jgi:hypothetical protein
MLFWKIWGALRAKSVYRLAEGWTSERFEFESRQSQEFSPLHAVRTGARDHPASYVMGAGKIVPKDKATVA